MLIRYVTVFGKNRMAALRASVGKYVKYVFRISRISGYNSAFALVTTVGANYYSRFHEIRFLPGNLSLVVVLDFSGLFLSALVDDDDRIGDTVLHSGSHSARTN